MTKTPRTILKNKGIRPLKRFGQTFIEDTNVIRKIVDLIEIDINDIVIEIGAGVGIITGIIASKAKKVLAIEVDPYMVGILSEELAGISNVDIIHTNVLNFDFSSARSMAETVKNIKVFGNIPYNISSQILFRLIGYRSYLSMLILMFQKEMADRITAQPNSKDYGIPAVIVDMYMICSNELTIPGSCFYPKPKVDSSVLKMVFRDKTKIDLKDEDLFIRIVKKAFSQRRKTLFNNLKNLGWRGASEKEVTEEALRMANIDGKRRAETLSAEEFGVLSNVFFSIKNA